MSKISSIYDALVTRMTAIYPTRLRLPNAYKPDENSELVLKSSWGISVDTASNTNRQVNCSLSIERLFHVILTQKAYSSEFNIDGKVSVEKLLLEDQFLAIQDIERNPVTDPTSNGAALRFLSDSGIQYVFTEKDNFYLIDTTFTIEYFEEV